MKMFLTTISQSSSQVQSRTVFEYSFSLFNPQDQKTIDDLTAAFTHPPTSQDWDNWLEDWHDNGYYLESQPRLSQII